MDMSTAQKELEKIVQLKTNEGISAVTALAAMLEFYRAYQVEAYHIHPDGDMLLFPYGSYDWDGTGKKFSLNFTRQIADPDDDDEYWQLQLTLYYAPEDIGEVSAYHLWCKDQASVEGWGKTISETEGFVCAAGATLLRCEVALAKT